jgi:hypothetical protein
VGVQYHQAGESDRGQSVFFDRDPDNPFDPDAVAVFASDGRQLGHLPRYDAAYFSPLIAEGAIALKGFAGFGDRADRWPLALEVYATSKVSSILVRDARDDYRAIYHNLFIDIWERLAEHSAATLLAFRDLFRPIAHDGKLYPKTQFIYRMLKAHIAAVERREQDAIRRALIEAVGAMTFGKCQGWPEMTVIPVNASGGSQPAQTQNRANGQQQALTVKGVGMPAYLHQLPSRCPYIAGTAGLAVFIRGRLFSFDWFESAEYAQVYWYPLILAGMDRALGGRISAQNNAELIPAEVQARLQAVLAQSQCARRGTQEEDGTIRIEIGAGEYTGFALYRRDALLRFALHESEPEVVDPQPSHKPPSKRAFPQHGAIVPMVE